MPSIERELSGDVLRFRLDEERQRVAEPSVLEQHGRCARTLVKEGPLRVTLIALGAGGEIAEHSADGPITVQPLTGSIRFTAAGVAYDLAPGDLLMLRARIRHSVRSDEGGSFLLTVSLGA
jgi:quercetin dioxygenase-like cupin family protein